MGKRRLRVVFNPDSLGLFLPANRSLIHSTPHRQLSVHYSDIAAIETRLEAYTSFVMANMQRPYALRLASGERVYLFEERAVGTGRTAIILVIIAFAVRILFGVFG